MHHFTFLPAIYEGSISLYLYQQLLLSLFLIPAVLESVKWFLYMFLKKFLLEYSLFTMLCQFQVYSQVNQLYIYPLFFSFFSHIGHQRVLSRVPCAIQQVLISYQFYIQQCVYVNPNLLIYPSPLSSLAAINSDYCLFC